jgi:hypothetical protein
LGTPSPSKSTAQIHETDTFSPLQFFHPIRRSR